MGSRSWNAKLLMGLDRKILASPDRFDDALGVYLSVNVVTVQFFCGGYRSKIRLYWHQNSAVLIPLSALTAQLRRHGFEISGNSASFGPVLTASLKKPGDA